MAEKASGIEKDLECPICLDVFRNARYLSCLHTFCADCIEDLSDRDQSVSCPECRQKTFLDRGTKAEGLKPNIVVNRLVDTLSKKFKLKDMKEEASVSMVSGDRKKSEEVGSEDGDLQVCRRHAPCVLKYFCKECREPICSECVMEKHILHVGEVCTGASLVDEMKEEMRARLEESKIKLGEQRKLIKNLDTKYQQGIEILGQAATDWKSSLDEHFAQLVDCKRGFNAKVGKLKQSQEQLEERRVGLNELGWDLVKKASAKGINETYQQWYDTLETISDLSDSGAWEEPEAVMEELADKCLDDLRRLTSLITGRDRISLKEA